MLFVSISTTGQATCDDNEPNLDGSNMEAIDADACDGTQQLTCTHQCSAGYESGSVTCGSDGNYAVVACTAIATHCDATEPNIMAATWRRLMLMRATALAWAARASPVQRWRSGSVTCGSDGTMLSWLALLSRHCDANRQILMAATWRRLMLMRATALAWWHVHHQCNANFHIRAP